MAIKRNLILASRAFNGHNLFVGLFIWFQRSFGKRLHSFHFWLKTGCSSTHLA